MGSIPSRWGDESLAPEGGSGQRIKESIEHFFPQTSKNTYKLGIKVNHTEAFNLKESP